MQPYPPPYMPPPYVPQTPPKKSGKTWIWVLGGCGCLSVLAMVAIIGVFLLLASSGGEIPPDKQAYIGNWSGEGTTLAITPDGKVNWTSERGSRSSKVENLPIKRFIGNDFEVGLGPFTTRFTVQRPPQFTAGRWRMTVEGVQVTRAGASTDSSPGSGGLSGDDRPSGRTQLRDIKMARMLDEEDMEFTSSFRKSETKLTCVIYPQKMEIGQNYGSRWYAERVPRLPSNKLIGEVNFPAITEETSQLTGIRLSLTSNDGFPPGMYRVDIVQDGTVVGTSRFTVE
ncbi:MAG: hypothetical protein ACUVR8_09915 [Acidobacteriota bacterium]